MITATGARPLRVAGPPSLSSFAFPLFSSSRAPCFPEQGTLYVEALILAQVLYDSNISQTRGRKIAEVGDESQRREDSPWFRTRN